MLIPNEEPSGLCNYHIFVTSIHFQEMSSTYSRIETFKASRKKGYLMKYSMAFLNREADKESYCWQSPI